MPRTTAKDAAKQPLPGSAPASEAPQVDLEADLRAIVSGTAASLGQLLQARLSVSDPGDAYEREAERVAGEFVSSAHGRRATVSELGGGQAVSRAATTDEAGGGLSTDGATTTDGTAAAIKAASAGGNALDAGTRSRFEQFFGSDLSGVRVHADSTADGLARAVNAQAFTTGRDVFFAAGQYRPGTPAGDHVLAHELTHVVQQGAPSVSRIFGWSADEKKAAEAKKKADFEKKMDARAGGAKDDMTVAEDYKALLLDNNENLDQVAEGAGGAGGGLAKGVTTSVGVGDGTINAGGVDSSVKADGGSIATAVVTGTVGIFLALKDLATNWKNRTDTEHFEGIVATLQSALSTTEGALKLAVAAGSTAASAIPGIGLAITLVDTAKRVWNLLRLRELSKGHAEMSKQIVAAGEKGDQDLAISLETMKAKADDRALGEVGHLIGNLIVAAGQIGMLSGIGSPWGAALAISGTFIKAGVDLVAQIGRWREAAKIQAARTKVADATKALKEAKSPEEKQAANEALTQAKREQLTVDAWAASEKILEKATTLDDKGQPSPEMVKILAPYGITADWIKQYNDKGRPSTMFENGLTTMVRFVGSSKDPLTFTETLKAAWGSVVAIWNKLVGNEKGDVLTPMAEISTRAREKFVPAATSGIESYINKAKSGDEMGKRLTDAYAKPFQKLKGLFAPEVSKGTKYEANAKANLTLIQTEAEKVIVEVGQKSLADWDKVFVIEKVDENGVVSAKVTPPKAPEPAKPAPATKAA